MVVTLSGIVMLVRLSQSSNARRPILVTLSGIVTVVRLSQWQNAPTPMVVTLSGIVMLVRLVQSSNAPPAIPFVPSLMITSDGQSPSYLHATLPA